MSKKHYLLILLALGLLTRFMFFGHPNQTVFDEVHFGKFVSGYYTKEYFFDIHPPLGKLAIAGFAKLFYFKPEFAFGEIGDPYPDKQYLVLRFLPSLAGALLPLVIFLLLLELGMRPPYAFIGGLLLVFENAILTQSIYILMDSFLLLFGFLSVYFYLRYKRNKEKKYLYLFSVLAGCALSIKWTGLGFLALPLAFEFVELLALKQLKNILKLALPAIIAFLIYFLFFAIHLGILTKSGPGDAFMSQGFQKTLIGNRVSSPETVEGSNIFNKFVELNAEMYKANQRLTAEHPYSSQWYTWPLMTRPIYYWVNNSPSADPGQTARIYLIGNPAIWWVSTAAVLYSVIYLLLSIKKFEWDKTYLFLLSGYIINILPFVGVKRVMFLYHYFTALIFAILIFIYLLNKQKVSWKILGPFLGIVVVLFIFFAPLNYGLELSPKAYEARAWLDSWK